MILVIINLPHWIHTKYSEKAPFSLVLSADSHSFDLELQLLHLELLMSALKSSFKERDY